MRSGVIALSSHTGWSLAEMKALPTREFLWWLKGLPKPKK